MCGGNKTYWITQGCVTSSFFGPCIWTSSTMFIIPAAEWAKLKPSVRRILDRERNEKTVGKSEPSSIYLLRNGREDPRYGCDVQFGPSDVRHSLNTGFFDGPKPPRVVQISRKRRGQTSSRHWREPSRHWLRSVRKNDCV